MAHDTCLYIIYHAHGNNGLVELPLVMYDHAFEFAKHMGKEVVVQSVHTRKKKALSKANRRTGREIEPGNPGKCPHRGAVPVYRHGIGLQVLFGASLSLWHVS